MISPRAGLLWGIGLWVIPLNLAAVLDPRHATAWLLAMAPFFLAAAVDALLVRKGLSGLRLELPDVSRHTLNRESALQVVVRKEGSRPIRAGLRIEFPDLLAPMEGRQEIRFEGGPGNLAVQLPVRPVRRGQARIARFGLDMRSPLGLWDLHARGRTDCGVKVYPDLSGGSAGFSSPERQAAPGAHRGALVGKGWEFEKLREYIHGDDFHDIHWKATARKGVPVTKTFQVENTQQIYAMVDISRFSAMPYDASPAAGTAATPLEVYIRSALRLGLAAERQGDYYGLMVYGDQPTAFVPAGKGKTHYGMYRDALYDVQSRPGSPDYPALFAAIRMRLRKRALLLFFCDLEDPAVAGSFLDNIGMISRQHLVSVHMIRPPGIQPLFGDRAVEGAEDVYDRLADQLWLQNLGVAVRSLKRQGVSFQAWEPARFSLEAISSYLDAKRRQVLG